MEHPGGNSPLASIRLAELQAVIELLKERSQPPAAVLEIGAGTGLQAKELSNHGYEVTAIDLATSHHCANRAWPIIDYDGKNIPAPDASIDIVFTSSVLEHVEELTALNAEIHRVIRDPRLVIHLVPTASWRVWSLIAFYPALARQIFLRIFRTSRGSSPQNPTTQSPKPGLSVRRIVRHLVPRGHGAMGGIFDEISQFRKASWDKRFKAMGWRIEHYDTNRLFVTGEMLLGAKLSISKRRALSRILGSGAHLYILRPARKRETPGAVDLSAILLLLLSVHSELDGW